MQILILHSWHDKTTADMLAHDLEGSTDVWLDTEHVTDANGHPVSLERFMSHMDMVILLWSRHCAEDPNITQQLSTALAQNRPLQTCLLDHTPLPEGLNSQPVIDLSEYKQGISALYGALLKRHYHGIEPGRLPDEDSSVSEPADTPPVQHESTPSTSSTDDVTPVEPQASTTKAQPTHDWLNDIHTQYAAALEQQRQILQATEALGEFLDNVTLRLQQLGGSRQELLKLLGDVTAREADFPDILRPLRSQLERELEQLPEPKPEPPPPKSKPRHRPQDGPLEQALQQHLHERVHPQDMPHAVALLANYLRSMHPCLDALHDLAIKRRSQAGMEVVQFLTHYLDNADDLFPADGPWGYLDDAWLIINTAYRVVEAGLAKAEHFPLDWQQIARADHLIIQLLPQRVHATLENYLQEIMRLIAREARAYQPNFTGDRRNYRPHMGEARAVGGVDQQLNDWLRATHGHSHPLGWRW